MPSMGHTAPLHSQEWRNMQRAARGAGSPECLAKKVLSRPRSRASFHEQARTPWWHTPDSPLHAGEKGKKEGPPEFKKKKMEGSSIKTKTQLVTNSHFKCTSPTWSLLGQLSGEIRPLNFSLSLALYSAFGRVVNRQLNVQMKKKT